MIDENLFDVHAGNWDIRFCLYRWKEKLLCAKADNENCNDCDDVMYAHEWRLGLMVEPVLANSADGREHQVDRFGRNA